MWRWRNDVGLNLLDWEEAGDLIRLDRGSLGNDLLVETHRVFDVTEHDVALVQALLAKATLHLL